MRYFFFLFVILLVLSCGSPTKKFSILPYYNSLDYTPEWIAEEDKAYEQIHTIGAFNFTDHHGNPITNDSLDGYIYIADFFFTSCPSICPKLTLSMEEIQNRFLDEERVKLISHTVMPWVDSVALLNQYAENMKINYDKWKLLTGDEHEIYSLARKSYFADEQFGFTDDESEFLHTDKLILVDPKRRIRGIYSGLIEADMSRLKKDISLLLVDSY